MHSILVYSYSIFTIKMESVQYHFWPKNDGGEKWSRNIYFEITLCRKMVILVTEFVILLHFYEVREKSLPHGGIEE